MGENRVRFNTNHISFRLTSDIGMDLGDEYSTVEEPLGLFRDSSGSGTHLDPLWDTSGGVSRHRSFLAALPLSCRVSGSRWKFFWVFSET